MTHKTVTTTWVVVGGAVVLAFASVALFIGVAMRIQTLQQETATLGSETELLKRANENAYAMRRVLRAAAEGDMDVLQNALVSEEELVGLLERLEDLGNITGAEVSVRSVSVQGENVGAGAKKGAKKNAKKADERIRIQLDVTGTFQEVYRTLALLTAFPQAVAVVRSRMVQDPTDFFWRGEFTLEAEKRTD